MVKLKSSLAIVLAIFCNVIDDCHFLYIHTNTGKDHRSSKDVSFLVKAYCLTKKFEVPQNIDLNGA